MAKRLVIFFIVITSMELFNIIFLGKNLIKIAELAGIGVVLLVILLQSVYNRDEGFKLHFKWEILLIFISLILSMLMAYSGHNQSFGITAVAQRFMYFYFFYFALHLIRISDLDLKQMFIYLAVVHTIFYMLQFAAYPTILFDIKVSDSRGTLRIFLAGLSYLILAYFYVLNNLFKDFSIGKLALLFFFFSVFILMGTRQIIISMFLLTIINVLLSKRVKSKFLILMLVVLATIPIIVMFQDIFLNLLSVSKEQSEDVGDDTRVRAATFFLTELFPNDVAYFTGNGVSSANSGYGVMIQMYMDLYGFYQSDIGLIGDYCNFGVLFVLAVFILIIRVLLMKLDQSHMFIKYFYITVLLTLFTGGGPFARGDSIVTICMTLYLIDVFLHNKKSDEEESVDETDDIEDPENTEYQHYLQ
ncbi:MAG: hypothetical protein IPN08_03785 [Bacteroidales bacterium]|nr:hypothetical protein [Bacteroidales bacterium]MBK9356502.1 hypothetical protein [Bacteroidales bacterium]